MENIPFIKSYIVVPFISSIDEIHQSFYYDKAYAVDSERRNLIIFNLHGIELQGMKRVYPLAQVFTDTDNVPEHYTELFGYVNAQIEVNLKRVKSQQNLRWIGAYANPNRGIIKMASSYHLHGVDANNPPKEPV